MQKKIANGLALHNAIRINSKGIKGVSTLELFMVLLILGIIGSLAAQQYQGATAKHRLTHSAELIVVFVNTVRSESVKRSKPITVSYVVRDDGQWCLGAVQGNKPCDCMQSDVTAPDFCAIDSRTWMLSDTDVQSDNLISSVSGDGSFTFDPVRGIFVDSFDTLTLGLQSGKGQFHMNLRMIATGRPSLCLPPVSQKITGYKSCS